MSFRKRNIGLSNNTESTSKPSPSTPKVQVPGVRPSAIDGRPVTSTGTASLDALLAGHGGLALGCSFLIEENGATDYAGALLKFYAAEGVLQGHHVHVLGLPESWGRDLPGTARESSRVKDSGTSGEKMKIAWRYESLGQFGAGSTGSRGPPPRQPPLGSEASQPPTERLYNHTFDLTKRLAHPSETSLTFHPFSQTPTPSHSPFLAIINGLKDSINANNSIPHRLIVPSLLSPLLYPPNASQPQHLLSFLHSLRALLALNASTKVLTIITSIPLPLSPRNTGLTRWIELLHDGVIELSPFPHSTDTLFAASSQASKAAAAAGDEPPQGLLKIHKLPVFTDRASGVRSEDGGDDWAFTLSRRKFAIQAWRLGPVDGDPGEEAEPGGTHSHGDEPREGKRKKGKKAEGMDF
ncbi:Elongator complex protein 4 [Cyphellophora attinorum]|uniref:Elongator complex protein 4 n=1 Tax=Cyphellophora attinorum TaxID=1664694 RepID=A0A0N0NKZ4_9EURO|nr:Elongator complex protein 4 [Phialophora attinorum]KPI38588.1 Elongator complex protein 4 [Phialophora attinorum]